MPHRFQLTVVTRKIVSYCSDLGDKTRSGVDARPDNISLNLLLSNLSHRDR